MRIAICFSGQIRTGPITAPNILRYIGDLLPNCDFFVHTWSTESKGTGVANRIGVSSITEDIHTTAPVNKSVFAEFYAMYNPTAMVVEEYDLVPTKPIWGGRRLNPRTGRYYVSMWESMYESNLLKMTYAQKNQLTYDYTVRIRPDIVFAEGKSLREDIALLTDANTFAFGDHYNIWPSYNMHRLEDIFFIGPTPVMDKIAYYHEAYINMVSNTDKPSEPGYEDWQWHSAKWITHSLGLRFRALDNNQMRIYSDIDVTEGNDPLNPGFGNPPGSYKAKQ